MAGRTSQWPLRSNPVDYGRSWSPGEVVGEEKNEKDVTLVVGTTNLYEKGKLRLIPVSVDASTAPDTS
jgi:hypothetical protein